MIITKRTTSDDTNFQELVKLLDIELQERDGDEHSFYAALNKTNTLNYVIVAYDQDKPIGCGALRTYSKDTMEVKRMFVPLQKRGQGIASKILKALEIWCQELGIKKCVLETGKNQPEAIALYKKNHYNTIPNFGKYEGVENSVCFEKEL
ncbi:GNAT family N-acetyltransferase [Flavobacterium sp.]|uniref:GNAT family N-acetyltransferase n=1 Tax=Flavobacterium sp. TaxID=239 RepID=UPI00375001CA